MKDMISKEFSTAELNVIWKRITAILKKEQVTIKEAWDTLKTLGKKRAAEEKLTTLCNYMKDPSGDAMAEHLLTVYEEIERTRTQERSQLKKYKGELNRIHGVAEANRLITNGTFVETTGYKGNVCYVKVEDKQVDSRQRTIRVQGQRHMYFQITSYFKNLLSDLRIMK